MGAIINPGTLKTVQMSDAVNIFPPPFMDTVMTLAGLTVFLSPEV